MGNAMDKYKTFDGTIDNYHVICHSIPLDSFHWSGSCDPDSFGDSEDCLLRTGWELGLPKWYVKWWNKWFGDELTRFVCDNI